jgi:hypothetical protein
MSICDRPIRLIGESLTRNASEPNMQRVIDHLETLRRFGQRLGPYLMLEILLPGGTLFALMLFLYQRRKAGIGGAIPRPVAMLMRLFASLVPQGVFVPQAVYVQTSRALRSAVDPRE